MIFFLAPTALLWLNRVQCSVEVEQGIQSVRAAAKDVVAPDLGVELVSPAALWLFCDLSSEARAGAGGIERLNQHARGCLNLVARILDYPKLCCLPLCIALFLARARRNGSLNLIELGLYRRVLLDGAAGQADGDEQQRKDALVHWFSLKVCCWELKNS